MADIKKLNSIEEYNDFINSPGTLNVIKCFADWCGPCRILSSTIQALSQEEVKDILIAEVNVDDEWFEDKLDELKIRGIPVLFAYKNGEEVDRVQGNQPKADLVNFFERNK